MSRALREVVVVDGVRTAFGRAGPKGMFWKTRADDMAVKVVRELLRRNPQIPLERIGDVVFAATAQVGDQGLTLGRDVALLAGIPQTVPGFAVDRMCAGALTAVTAGAGEIALGAADVVLAGGVEHMGHHPMAEEVEFNPRFVAERLVDPSAVTMGATAENLHDRFPGLTKRDADEFAVRSQRRAAAAWENGVMRETVVPMSVFTDDGWQVAGRDEVLRPGARDAQGPRASRADPRRDRPLRAERAVRGAGPHVVQRAGSRSRRSTAEPVRRRDRLRAPARGHGRPAPRAARLWPRRAARG